MGKKDKIAAEEFEALWMSEYNFPYFNVANYYLTSVLAGDSLTLKKYYPFLKDY